MRPLLEGGSALLEAAWPERPQKLSPARESRSHPARWELKTSAAAMDPVGYSVGPCA